VRGDGDDLGLFTRGGWKRPLPADDDGKRYRTGDDATSKAAIAASAKVATRFAG
jgi:hypothetical protein